MALNPNEVYVASCGGDVMFVGTFNECVVYQNSRVFNTSSWHVDSIEDFGQRRYEEGRDNGMDQGYEAGSEN